MPGNCPLFEQQLGLDEPVDDPRASIKFTGGETAGLARLNEYFSSISQQNIIKGGRNGSVEHSKLSPWLALGCISPRQVYWEG